MATQLELRGFTSAEMAVFTGANREVTVNTDTLALVVHDGLTPGGFLIPSGADLAEYGIVGDYFIGSGIADQYVLDMPVGRETVDTIDVGSKLRMIMLSDNTGASTLDISGLLGEVAGTTVLDIKLDEAGTIDPAAGDMAAGIESVFVYRTAGHVQLMNPAQSKSQINAFSGLLSTWSSGSSVSVGAGSATGKGVGQLIINLAAFTKTTSGPWVAGSGNAGLASGASLIANGSLYLFIVQLPSGGSDIIYDDNEEGANIFADTSSLIFRGVQRLAIDAVSLIYEYECRGGGYTALKTPIQDVSDSAPGTAIKTRSSSVPPSAAECADGEYVFLIREGTGTSIKAWARGVNQDNSAASIINLDLELASNTSRAQISKRIPIGAGGSLNYRVDTSTPTTDIFLYLQGWHDGHNW